MDADAAEGLMRYYYISVIHGDPLPDLFKYQTIFLLVYGNEAISKLRCHRACLNFEELLGQFKWTIIHEPPSEAQRLEMSRKFIHAGCIDVIDIHTLEGTQKALLIGAAVFFGNMTRML